MHYLRTLSLFLALILACNSTADIIVASDGSGNFKTVQEAVDAVPKAATKPQIIRIKPGTYKGRVTVAKERPMIHFIGEDAQKTILTESFNYHSLGPDGKEMRTSGSASVFLNADDFFAENITFENASGNVGQALAVSISGDRVHFHQCRFLGWQDTIYTRKGRQLFEDCYIAGHVDFIFGASTAWFERCHIHCLSTGYITAASTPAEQPFGYIFANCNITAEQAVKTYLGRPWRPNAAVSFMHCQLAAQINPAGWENWSNPENEKTARYSEFQNTGDGAKTDGRAKWASQLSKEQAEKITIETVLGGSDHWKPVTHAKEK